MRLLTLLLLVSILNVAFAQVSQKDPREIESASSDVLSASSVHKSAASETLTNKLYHKSSQVEDADHLYVKSVKSMKGRQVEKADGVDDRETVTVEKVDGVDDRETVTVEKVDGVDDRETVTVGVDRSPKIEQLRALKTMPQADGYLHMYVLPVGNGDAQVLQCPNGDIAIIDLGSWSNAKEGFWSANEIRNFLQEHNDSIKNIVISNDGNGQYRFFKDVFPSSKYLSGLRNIYFTCTFGASNSHQFPQFIAQVNAYAHLQSFNGGHACGFSNGKPCENIALCPGNLEVVTTVLSANAGNCDGSNPQMDSIVIRIKYTKFTMHLTGPFQDIGRSNPSENVEHKKMVDFYGSDLQVTVYKMSSEGSECFDNRPIMLDAVRPKSVFISASPFDYYYGISRCGPLDYLLAKKYLCKPAETDSTNEFYCGKHPVTDVTIDDKLQQEFACAQSHSGKVSDDCYGDELRIQKKNDFAIYTTAPSNDTINLIHLLTDGNKWGFVNNIQPRIQRTR